MARPDKNQAVGERVGSGPHGPIHELLSGDRVDGLVELVEGTEAERGLALRGERLAGLRHPFLVRVLGTTRVQGRAGLVLETLSGTDLGELMSAGRVPHGAAIDLFRKAARALHAAWDRKPAKGDAPGLVHGSLEPQDLAVGADGHLRLHGLGMLPPAGQDGPTALPARGSSPWVAPELLQSGLPDHAADIYALGAILAQAVSGQSAPWASTSADWHGAAVSAAVQHVLDATGDTELAELVAIMLAHDRALRPSAHDVEQALTRLRRHHPKDALEAWCRTAVPRARESFELRIALDAGAVAELARERSLAEEEADTAEVEPVAPVPQADEEETEADFDADGNAPQAGEGEHPHRRLWEIRGPVEPGGPSRVLDWSDSTRETTDQLDRQLLREAVPDPLVEDPSEVIDLGTGRFVVTEAGLQGLPSDQALDVAVVPAARATEVEDDHPTHQGPALDGRLAAGLAASSASGLASGPAAPETADRAAPSADRAPAPPVVPRRPVRPQQPPPDLGLDDPSLQPLPPYATPARSSSTGWLLGGAGALAVILLLWWWTGRGPEPSIPGGTTPAAMTAALSKPR